MQPLTHHQILGLVAPFTRAGLQVDLAASQRLQRRLAFRPLQHAAVDGGHPALTETWWLDAADDSRHKLSRVLTGPDGLDATLDAEGTDAAALLNRLAAVPLQRQWHQGPGWTMALSHTATGAPDAPAGGLQLNRAAVQLPGFRLRWTPPPVHSRLAELRLAAAGDGVQLPEDLLAVLGHPWTRLTPLDGAWMAHLRQRGTGLAAFARAEQRLLRTAEHLARTLAAPPAQFHARHRLARWRVAGRRAVPALLSLGLVAGAAAVPQISLAPESVMRMLILNAPPLLLIGFFCLREVPRIEIPPLPRALRQLAWQAHPHPQSHPQSHQNPHPQPPVPAPGDTAAAAHATPHH
jgi:hypothetical protein